MFLAPISELQTSRHSEPITTISSKMQILGYPELQNIYLEPIANILSQLQLFQNKMQMLITVQNELQKLFS